MKRLPALAGALALLCTPTQAGAKTYQHERAVRAELAQSVRYHRTMTWRWQDRTHVKRSETSHRERHASVPVLHRLAHYWEHRHYVAWRRYERYRARVAAPAGLPPHYTAWLCIHRGEGSWTAATGNGYYGGLQMDYGFMSSYGGSLLRSKGTANNWTPLEQMWVAEKAYESGRGFYPWPNTARACGLI